METSDTNDYYLSYSKPFKAKKYIRTSKTSFSLLYGSEIILKDKPRAICEAELNRLRRNVNYRFKKFKIV